MEPSQRFTKAKLPMLVGSLYSKEKDRTIMLKNNSKIGKVITDFSETGEIQSVKFVPAEFENALDIDLDLKGQVKDESQLNEYAKRVLATYFVHIGNVEMHDPDLATIKQEVLICEKQ